METTKKDNKNVINNEKILKSYECGGCCRICPFPGGKCDKYDAGNVKTIIAKEG